MFTGCPPRPLYHTYQLPGISSSEWSQYGRVSVTLGVPESQFPERRPPRNELYIHYEDPSRLFDRAVVFRRDAGEVVSLGTVRIKEASSVVVPVNGGAVFRDTLGARLTSRYEVYALFDGDEQQRLPVRYDTADQAYAKKLGAL